MSATPTITPWNTRLEERLREGAERYGTLTTCHADPLDLVVELANETADAAGWAWVLHVRTITVPDPARGGLTTALSRLAALAMRLHTQVRAVQRAIQAMPREGLTARPPVTWQVLYQWCESAILELDAPEQLMAEVDDEARLAFFRRIDRRTTKGADDYGNRSFYRRPSELARELGDEIVSVAGWASVLATRLGGEGNLEPPLGALVRGARIAYLRAMGLALIAAEWDESAPPPVGLVAPTAAWWAEEQVRAFGRGLQVANEAHVEVSDDAG